MRITSSRCRAFEYTVTAPAACAVELDAAAIGVAHSFTDCLVVSIALERGEDLAFIDEAARAILRLATTDGAASIVIDGSFRPLPRRAGDWPCRDVLVELADALDSVAEIARRLVVAGARVHLMPFGWHTGTRTETPKRTSCVHPRTRKQIARTDCCMRAPSVAVAPPTVAESATKAMSSSMKGGA